MKKKAEIIKSHLLENYEFKISNHEKIEYNIFPLPNLELNNAQIHFEPFEEKLNVKKVKIYLDLLSIYNYKNFNTKKIILKESELSLHISKLNFFLEKLFLSKK